MVASVTFNNPKVSQFASHDISGVALFSSSSANDYFGFEIDLGGAMWDELLRLALAGMTVQLGVTLIGPVEPQAEIYRVIHPAGDRDVKTFLCRNPTITIDTGA